MNTSEEGKRGDDEEKNRIPTFAQKYGIDEMDNEEDTDSWIDDYAEHVVNKQLIYQASNTLEMAYPPTVNKLLLTHH